MPSSDLNFQNFSSVQDAKQPTPVTVTAAASITPQSLITVLTGNTAVATIVPPVAGQHSLIVVPGTTTGFTTGGNVVGGTTTVANRACLLAYNPIKDAAFTTGGHYYVVSVGQT